MAASLVSACRGSSIREGDVAGVVIWLEGFGVASEAEDIEEGILVNSFAAVIGVFKLVAFYLR